MKPLWLIAPLLTAVAVAQPPVSLFPGSLKTYLQLTDSQVQQINSLNLGYDQFSAQKQVRIAQVRSDIVAKTAADPLDPLALGVRYAEIEAINRDLSDKQTELRANIGKALTAAQQPRLQALGVAQSRIPLEAEAECQNLLPPAHNQASVSAVFAPSIGGIMIGGVVTGVLSQVLPVPYAGCASVPFPADLTAYLGFSTTQLDAISRLNAAYTQFNAQKQQRIADLRVDIAAQTAAATLDPGTLGQDYAEIEAIQRDLRDKLAGLRTDLGKVLTIPQQALLKALTDAAGQQSLVNAAVCENLLAPPPQQWFNTPGLVLNGDFSALIPGDPTIVPVITFTRQCGI